MTEPTLLNNSHQGIWHTKNGLEMDSRQKRIVRYKEERRKQLANQFDPNIPSADSVLRFRKVAAVPICGSSAVNNNCGVSPIVDRPTCGMTTATATYKTSRVTSPGSLKVDESPKAKVCNRVVRKRSCGTSGADCKQRSAASLAKTNHTRDVTISKTNNHFDRNDKRRSYTNRSHTDSTAGDCSLSCSYGDQNVKKSRNKVIYSSPINTRTSTQSTNSSNASHTHSSHNNYRTVVSNIVSTANRCKPLTAPNVPSTYLQIHSSPCRTTHSNDDNSKIPRRIIQSNNKISATSPIKSNQFDKSSNIFRENGTSLTNDISEPPLDSIDMNIIPSKPNKIGCETNNNGDKALSVDIPDFKNITFRKYSKHDGDLDCEVEHSAQENPLYLQNMKQVTGFHDQSHTYSNNNVTSFELKSDYDNVEGKNSVQISDLITDDIEDEYYNINAVVNDQKLSFENDFLKTEFCDNHNIQISERRESTIESISDYHPKDISFERNVLFRTEISLPEKNKPDLGMLEKVEEKTESIESQTKSLNDTCENWSHAMSVQLPIDKNSIQEIRDNESVLLKDSVYGVETAKLKENNDNIVIEEMDPDANIFNETPPKLEIVNEDTESEIVEPNYESACSEFEKENDYTLKPEGSLELDIKISELSSKDCSEYDEISEAVAPKTKPILKKKSLDESVSENLIPTSILKRKTSQDSSNTPPICNTLFSNGIQRQGILKKYSSLDETECRRKSCTADFDISKYDFKPILKNQHRSSLEELVGVHARSSDLPSILKRKQSSEETVEYLSEPHGILKRKYSQTENPFPYLSINESDSNYAQELLLESTESIKPILKNRGCIVEQNHSVDKLSSNVNVELPRPILKKKVSSDFDEFEDKRKKPILKLNKKSTEEELDTKYGIKSNDSKHSITQSIDGIKPILKKNESLKDGELSDNSFSDIERNNYKRPLSNFIDDSHNKVKFDTYPKSRPLSVSDRIITLENFLAQEAISEKNRFDDPETNSSTNSVAIKTQFTRNRERFRTQPITRQEIFRSSSCLRDNVELSNSVSSRETSIKMAEAEIKDHVKVHSTSSASSDVSSHHDIARSNIVSKNVSLFSNFQSDCKKSSDDSLIPKNKGSAVDRYKDRKLRLKSLDSSRYSTQPITSVEVQEAKRQNSESQSVSKTSETENEDIEPSKLSIADRVKLFSKFPAISSRIIEEKIQVPKMSDDKENHSSVSKDMKLRNISSTKKASIISKLDDIYRVKLSQNDYSKSCMPQKPIEGVSKSCVGNESSTNCVAEDNKSGVSEVHENILKEIKISKSCKLPDTRSNSERDKTKINLDHDISKDKSASLECKLATSGISNCVKDSECKTSEFEEDKKIMKSATCSNIGDTRQCTMNATSIDFVDDGNTLNGKSSIAERLAALKRSGQLDWKKRVTRPAPENEYSPSNGIAETQEALRKELMGALNNTDLSIDDKKEKLLTDRLGKLENATHGWKKRVEPSDAVQFSVAGKMAGAVPILPSLLPAVSPVSERKKRAPCPARFRSKHYDSQKSEVHSSPTSPEKSSLSSTSYNRSISLPNGVDSPNEDTDNKDGEDNSRPANNVILVPQICDESFSTFFGNSLASSSVTSVHQPDNIDFEQIKTSSSPLLSSHKRVIRIQRKHGTSRNPLKALAANALIKQEYEEIQYGVAEKELKRVNIQKLSKNSSLALEALAGLASKEDFTSVSLKKAGSPIITSMLPYKALMLLHIKGRRHVQTRLVQPCCQSINTGDSYVLVSSTEVYHWIGQYSNVIERSRGAEIAQHILTTHDLGCSASHIITINSSSSTNSKEARQFWILLGATADEAVSVNVAAGGHPDEDELYESALISTNMIYEASDDELVPMDKYWGGILKIEMLDPNKVIVFDFGTEMYIWMGKNVDLKKRKSSVHLAKELWDHGFDYTECDICPISSSSFIGNRADDKTLTEQEQKKATERPSWCLLAKVTQHMETVLFREKFVDWPDFTRVIRAKGIDDDTDKQIGTSTDIKPCDVNEMIEQKLQYPDLQLEGNHLGRGTQYYDEELRRYCNITTLDVRMWHISEFDSKELPKESLGQFHSGDSYIVRWLYSVTFAGRELSGLPSRHMVTGRDRCAYFCWQGRDASLNEQGAAALLTVELDKEKGPQMRISQGYEPPAFYNLFGGRMITYKGKRDKPNTNKWRLYICKGEVVNEAALLEVSCNTRQLRSRTSFVLINTCTNQLYIWHGIKSSAASRRTCVAAVKKIEDDCPIEFGLNSEKSTSVLEVIEGEEPKHFFEGLNNGTRKLYASLLNNEQEFNSNLLLYHLSSNTGSFISTPMNTTCGHPDFITPFPFLQHDLYSSVTQPALFLLDFAKELWLWQGWWPEHETITNNDNVEDTEEQICEDENSCANNGCNYRGSATVRWQADRRAAMQTALDYWNTKYKSEPVKAYLVWAGLEPLEFTNLFPEWEDRDDIAEINIKDGRKPGEILSVEQELARLTQSTYPLEQLLQRPLPDGVDPTKLELYLAPHYFQEALNMTKEEFSTLPSWKQTNIKKLAGLF